LFCTQCGHRNAEGARFCAKCGHSLEEDITAKLSAVEIEDETGEEVFLGLDELEPGQALLVVKRGPGAGSKFLIDKDEITAGRHPESDIFLNDITVSRKHMRLRREKGHFLVQDLGSLNGTYVNRELVEETQLANGDELQVGKFKLVFFTAAE
jgi:pSer/pThr/pTyr-binding forkhead associated (FHA) protein